MTTSLRGARASHGTTSWSGVVALRAGPNTIYARATDAAGNSATTSVTVVADTVARDGGAPWTLAIAAVAVAIVAAAVVVVRRRRSSEGGR